MRLPIVNRIEVDQRELPQLGGLHLEDSLGLGPLGLAAVQHHCGLVVLSGELGVIVALQLDGVVVVARAGVVPCCRVDTGVSEVLVSLATHQSEECQLDWPE